MCYREACFGTRGKPVEPSVPRGQTYHTDGLAKRAPQRLEETRKSVLRIRRRPNKARTHHGWWEIV